MSKFSSVLCTLTLIFLFGCDSTKKIEKSKGEGAAKSADSPVEQVEASLPSATDKNPAIADQNSDIPKSSGNIPFSLKFLSWNVESDGAKPATISKQLSEMGKYDVIALTEVLPGASAGFCKAFGDDYQYVMGETGRNDRMMLIYNTNSLKYIRKFELHDVNYKRKYRSPLVVHFQDLLTGKELLVMVNHLARGSEEARQLQAKKLVQWARQESMPIVALGDYNFDYVFETRGGNEAFRLFMKDSVWEWVEPVELVDTNWYDNPQEPDGKDDYPGSMLDFVFVAGPAKDWTKSCKIIVRDGDFPDSEQTSDHRPYELIVSGK